MPVLPSRSSDTDNPSTPPPIPSRYSIIDSSVTDSPFLPLPILVIASALITAILIRWSKRRRAHFDMSQYPSRSDKSLGRSSPPPSAMLKSYPLHQPSAQPQPYGRDPPPPAPTIRRQSDVSEVSRMEVAEGQKGANVSPAMVGDGQHPIKLPPPWVPGRTDTFVTLNGCRRHMMVIEGQPFRRGTA